MSCAGFNRDPILTSSLSHFLSQFFYETIFDICGFLVLLFPALASGATLYDLVERERLFYTKVTNVPFTGKTTGQIPESSFQNGVRDGPWVNYTEDGTVSEHITGTYKDGVKVKLTSPPVTHDIPIQMPINRHITIR